MQRRFATLDVFTDRRFAGNPLAVVLDADGLDPAAMQAVAREFNHPETVFVLPPQDTRHRTRLRIFTPARELPFAGHPTVGTAVLLALQDGAPAGREIVLEEAIGAVRCTFEADSGERGRVRFVIPQLPAEPGPCRTRPRVPRRSIFRPPTSASAGFGRRAGRPAMPSRLCRLRACRYGARGTRSGEISTRRSISMGQRAAFLYCGESAEPGHDFHARMFAPKMGVTEDPATGSAAAAFAGVLARFAGLPDGEHTMVIEQGYEMGRPSLIHLA